MKAVLVIDEMPTRCLGCPCYYEDKGRCQNTWESVEDDLARPSWCPLKPIPQKKILDEELLFMSGNFRLIQARFTGWNDCIDTLLGETE